MRYWFGCAVVSDGMPEVVSLGATVVVSLQAPLVSAAAEVSAPCWLTVSAGLGIYEVSAAALVSGWAKVVSGGICPMVVSAGATVVSVTTAVVSCSGAAPTSSSVRPAQATANEAAAARINRFLIDVLLERRDPARLRVSTLLSVCRGLNVVTGRAVTSRVA
jgi:hypothetical protein